MGVDGIRGLGSLDPRRAYAQQGPAKADGGFADALSKAIEKVDDLQKGRDQKVEQMVMGQVGEAHDVMIAAEEAQLAFELLLEVRNRLLESYQEIMRMQV